MESPYVLPPAAAALPNPILVSLTFFLGRSLDWYMTTGSSLGLRAHGAEFTAKQGFPGITHIMNDYLTSPVTVFWSMGRPVALSVAGIHRRDVPAIRHSPTRLNSAESHDRGYLLDSGGQS